MPANRKVETVRTWNLLEFLPNANKNHYQDIACNNKIYILKAVIKKKY